MDRARRARKLARLEFAVAVAACLMAPFVLIAAPGTMGGVVGRPMAWVAGLPELTLLLGIAGIIVGLVLMIRIYRADPEPDQRAWRYRERD